MLNIITQEAAFNNVCQLESKLFDLNGATIEAHPKYQQIIACYKRMRLAAIAPRFNAIAYLAAENNLSTFLSQTK